MYLKRYHGKAEKIEIGFSVVYISFNDLTS